jgi:hypothetical protein
VGEQGQGTTQKRQSRQSEAGAFSDAVATVTENLRDKITGWVTAIEQAVRGNGGNIHYLLGPSPLGSVVQIPPRLPPIRVPLQRILCKVCRGSPPKPQDVVVAIQHRAVAACNGRAHTWSGGGKAISKDRRTAADGRS